MFMCNCILLNHTSHINLFDTNSAGSILEGYCKLCVNELTPYIQDSLKYFYDCFNNILYVVYDIYLSDNIYKYIDLYLYLVHYKQLWLS